MGEIVTSLYADASVIWEIRVKSTRSKAACREIGDCIKKLGFHGSVLVQDYVTAYIRSRAFYMMTDEGHVEFVAAIRAVGPGASAAVPIILKQMKRQITGRGPFYRVLIALGPVVRSALVEACQDRKYRSIAAKAIRLIDKDAETPIHED